MRWIIRSRRASRWAMAIALAMAASVLMSLPGPTAQAADPVSTIVYDTVPGPGPLRAIGQNVRATSSSTDVLLGAKVSSPTPIVADQVVFAVRRAGDTGNYDIAVATGYTIDDTQRTVTGSRRFAVGSYTFWFAYRVGSSWYETDRRAFAIADSGTAPVPLDPVATTENSPILTGIGADYRTAYSGAPVRFAATLSSPTDRPVDQTIFAIRDANGQGHDVRPTTPISVIGTSTSAAATKPFDVGTYTYWFAYHDASGWHDLGAPRTLVITTPPAVPTPPNASWTKIPSASDEFTTFDATKWRKSTGYPVSSNSTTGTKLAFKDTNVTVAGGVASLTAKKESYNGAPYTAGVLESSFDVPGQGSYVEVRARVLDSRANVLSAIWLQTFPLSAGRNPNPEIDVHETFNYSQLISTEHTWTLTGTGTDHQVLDENRATTGVADMSTDFHVYGLERRDGWLRFYFDGRLLWQSRPSVAQMASMPRHLILSLEAHLGQPNDTFLPASFGIDWVRTYAYTGT